MSMHNTNSLLKYVIPVVVVLVVWVIVLDGHHANKKSINPLKEIPTNNVASNDSAAESLDTLTAELAATKQQVAQVAQDNTQLKSQNEFLLKKSQGVEDATTQTLSQEVDALKNQIQQVTISHDVINSNGGAAPITTVPDLTLASNKTTLPFSWINSDKSTSNSVINASSKKPKIIPYYTIPANATAVKDRLMTALVGRIPIKGVVTDPYPFKIVFSNDTLAANGLRVPNLRQMIVSGYTEGDLNLLSVRGWVTSLTFVFNDGTISTTTSNNNDIGHFTKANALGYLSDARGNPFIRGKLITNAPTYLAGNIALGAAEGAASAYAQEQTTSQTSILGSNVSSVTGSPSAYVAGQAGVSAASQAQQWWHDREENSFDAIYVPTVDQQGQPIEISVNFAKEIDIDYNPKGRKLDYAHSNASHVSRNLD